MAALASVDDVEGSWLRARLDDAFAVVAGRFFRREVRVRARACLGGMLSGLERKTSWSWAGVAPTSLPPLCLQARLEAERQLAPLPPVVTGGALVVPAGLLASSRGTAHARSLAERTGLNAVMTAERALGRNPVPLPPGHSQPCTDVRKAVF